MKIYLSASLIVLILFASCVKTDNDPGCNVKGSWIGQWSSGEQEGTWLCYAGNDNTNLGGYVFVWFDKPLLENHGVGVEGTLKNRQVFLKHYFSGATLTVNGNVETDSIASGSFTVSNISMSGTWQGKRMPTLNLSVLDSFALDYDELYQLDLACDVDRNHLYITDNGTVDEYNYKCNLIRSFSVERSGRFCFDGNHLWFLNLGYGKITETDTLGEKVSEFNATNNYSDAIMFDESNLKEVSGYSRKIYSISKNGVLLGSQDFSYLMITGLCKYGEGYLAISHSFPGTIFLISSSGIPQKAFRFTSGYLRGIAIDGDEIWCLSERYVISSSNPPMPPTSVVKLFKLRM